MKYLIFILVLISSGSCSSYRSIEFERDKLIGKNIVFHLTEESKSVEVEKKGMHFGDTLPPNILEVFKLSITGSARENKLNLKYLDELSNVKETEYLIIADLKKITWEFGFTNATMNAEIEYTLPNGYKVLKNGVFKTSAGGTKSENLFLALLNANGQILKQISEYNFNDF